MINEPFELVQKQRVCPTDINVIPWSTAHSLAQKEETWEDVDSFISRSLAKSETHGESTPSDRDKEYVEDVKHVAAVLYVGMLLKDTVILWLR